MLSSCRQQPPGLAGEVSVYFDAKTNMDSDSDNEDL